MAYQRNEQIKSMDFKGLGDFIETKFNEAQKFYNDNDSGKNFSTDDVVDFQSRNAELTEARVRFTELKAMEDSFKANHDFYSQMSKVNRPPMHDAEGGGREGNRQEQPYKSLGELFTETEAYKSHDFSSQRPLDLQIEGVSLKSLEDGAIKTTMTTSAGFAPFSPRTPRVVLTAQRRPVVSDLIPQDETTVPSIIWMEETTFTNNAATVAEGADKPEGALAYTQRNTPVQKIAVLLPVTEEQLADVPQARGLIDNRLQLMMLLAEETQLLTGDGNTPNLLGFLEKPGTGQITRGAGEDNPDAILRAITDVNSITGFADASGIVLHPLNWLAIRLLRTTTGDYIWGHPAVAGPATLWGLPVVATPAMTANTGLVGDFQMYSHISRRLGIRIDTGYINDDFKKNILRIRAEERLSLEIYRAAAFAEVLSLNQAA